MRGKSIKISAIFFLTHGKENKIGRLNEEEAFHKLLTVSLLPYGQNENLNSAFRCLKEMALNIPVYDFHFVPDFSAVEELNIRLKEEVL